MKPTRRYFSLKTWRAQTLNCWPLGLCMTCWTVLVSISSTLPTSALTSGSVKLPESKSTSTWSPALSSVAGKRPPRIGRTSVSLPMMTIMVCFNLRVTSLTKRLFEQAATKRLTDIYTIYNAICQDLVGPSRLKRGEFKVAHGS